MKNQKHTSDLTPLEHRHQPQEDRKYTTLEDSPLDTTPHRQVAHASEPDHHRIRHARHSWIPLFIIIFCVIVAIVAGVVGVFITRTNTSPNSFTDIQPTPTYFTAPTPVSEITNAEKEQIHKWLADNTDTLNPYGDPEGTVYAGGTPLFDESTGQSKSMYDYIISKHPDRPWRK